MIMIIINNKLSLVLALVVLLAACGHAVEDTDVSATPDVEGPVFIDEMGSTIISIPEVTMSEDGSPKAFALTLNAKNINVNDIISWSISSQPSHGTANVSDTGPNNSISYTPDNDYFGTDKFVVQVENNEGGKNSIDVNVVIEPINDAPFLTNNSMTISKGETVTLTESILSATDADNDELVYTLSGVVNGQFAMGASPTTAIANFTQTQVSSGAIVFVHDNSLNVPGYSITVSDGIESDGPGSAAVSLVKVDPAKSFATISPNSSTVLTNSTITIEVQSVDDLGNNRTVSGDNVNIEVVGANPSTLNVSYAGNGLYLASYMPTVSGDDLYNITIDGLAINNGTPYKSSINSPPVITSFSPDTDVLVVIDAYGASFSSTVTDIEDDAASLPLSYNWDFADSGIPPSNLNNPGYIYFAKSGQFVVTLTVTDSDGATASVTRTITANHAPTVSFVSPVPETTYIFPGESVFFDAIASDTEDDLDGIPLNIEWNLFNTGEVDSTVLNPGNITYANPGRYQIGLSVTDSNGTTARLPSKTYYVEVATPNIDMSFGSTGRGIVGFDLGETLGGTPPWASWDTGADIKISSSGQLIIAGHSSNLSGDYDLMLWRYDKNGNIDTTFGSNGFVQKDVVLGGNDFVTGIALANNGNIIVTGYTQTASTPWAIYMFVASYDVTLNAWDSKFGANGFVIYQSSNSVGSDIVIDTIGSIYITGYVQRPYQLVSGGVTYNGTHDLLALWKYDMAGVPVSTFANQGLAEFHNATYDTSSTKKDDYGEAVYIDNLNRILVTGSTEGPPSYARDMALWRFDSSTGLLDPGFGNSGYITYPHEPLGGNGPVVDSGEAIVVDQNNNIYVTGYLSTDHLQTSITDKDLAIWKYNDAGAVDSTFGALGVVIVNQAPNYPEEGRDIIIDSSSGIVIVLGAMHSKLSYYGMNLAIWGFDPFGEPVSTFGIDGLLTNSGFNQSDAVSGAYSRVAYSMVLDSTGTLFIVGEDENGERPEVSQTEDMVIWKYRTK